MKKRWIALLIVAAGALLSYLAYPQWDITIAYMCRGLSRRILDMAEIVTIAGDSKWYFILFVPAFLIFRFFLKNKNWSMKILFLLVSIAASGLINAVIKWIAGRNRPINLFNHGFFGFNYFEIGYELNSFPSGHAVTVFALATALSILFPRIGFLAFIPATAVAASRVMITSHFVSDVMTGAAVGAVCALGVKYCFDRLKIEFTPRSEVS